MTTVRQSRLMIIGSGPAGYTAGIYAARAGLAPLLVTGLTPGGQLTTTTDVENYPGFAEAVQGPWLMDQMREQAEHVGCELVYDAVAEVDLSERPFKIRTEAGDVFLADTLVLAMGAQARWLGLEAERAFSGYGVSACATCDGYFFRGKEVVVVGGGNTAVEEALYLTGHATKVTVVHRRDMFRAEQVLQDRLLANPIVSVLWNHVVEDIVGTTDPSPAVTALRLRDLGTGTAREMPTDGFFVAIGHDPSSALVRGQLDLDEAGYVKVAPWSTRTSVPGVFAAGDICDPVFRQAITSAGMGCMAAIEAGRFLAEHAPSPSLEPAGARAQALVA